MNKRTIQHRENGKILSFIIYILSIILMAIILLSFINNKDNIFGYTARIVVTGSMEPNIKINSLNIVKLCDIKDIEKNDVICFKYNQNDIIHRVIDKKNVNEEVILNTKGDANELPDSIEINSSMIVGKVTATFNGLSSIINKYSTSPGNLDELTLVKALITAVLVISLSIIVLLHLLYFLLVFIKAFKNQDMIYNDIDKYHKDIKELMVYNDIILSLDNKDIKNNKENRIRFICNKIAIARAEIEMRSLHSKVKEFKRSVKYIKYLDTLGKEIDNTVDRDEAN